MKIWALFKEVFSKYRDEWLKKRYQMGIRKNLALIAFVLAFAVLLIIVFKIFLYPGKPL